MVAETSVDMKCEDIKPILIYIARFGYERAVGFYSKETTEKADTHSQDCDRCTEYFQELVHKKHPPIEVTEDWALQAFYYFSYLHGIDIHRIIEQSINGIVEKGRRLAQEGDWLEETKHHFYKACRLRRNIGSAIREEMERIGQQKDLRLEDHSSKAWYIGLLGLRESSGGD
tara:strand:- start:14094 stop:14609 length:516 start_codon:yes stop_codon:yes gene_type:complete